MISIACTRFNNKTMKENKEYKKKTNRNDGCIYGCPLKITNIVPHETKLIVIEMNNETNKIIGFGLILNMIRFDQYHWIYDVGNLNRYTYQGLNRIDISEILDDDEKNKKIIELLELVLFKGKRHSKRGRGISLIPYWILDEYPHIEPSLKKMFKIYKQVLI